MRADGGMEATANVLAAPSIMLPLSIASVLLGLVGILIAISGVFAFMHLRKVARREAKRIAKTVAASTSEKAAVEYLQAELPNIVREYRELARNAATYEDGDDIADSESGEDR